MVDHYRWLTNEQINELLDKQIDKTIEKSKEHISYEQAFQLIHSLVLSSDQFQPFSNMYLALKSQTKKFIEQYNSPFVFENNSFAPREEFKQEESCRYLKSARNKSAKSKEFSFELNRVKRSNSLSSRSSLSCNFGINLQRELSFGNNGNKKRIRNMRGSNVDIAEASFIHQLDYQILVNQRTLLWTKLANYWRGRLNELGG